jgi:hypothetical protein
MVGTRIELLTYWDPQALRCVFAKRAMHQRSFPVSDHPPIRIGSATGAWQSLGPVQALHINLAVQPCANPPLYGEESKEYSECADVVLEGCGAPTFASTGDVGFEVAVMHLLELDSFFIQVPEKTLRCTPPL